MVFSNALLRLGGLVRVQVRGAAIERFLNICTRHGVVLRDLDRVDLGEFHATMSLADFKRLRGIMGRTGCRVHLLRRRGAPFVLHRFRKRYALFGGLAGLAALAWVLMAFVWVVHIPTTDGLSGLAIERNLRELGVRPGLRISALDAKAVQAGMMERMPELAFIALNVHGNRVDVEVHRREPKPEMLDGSVMTDVRATKAGVLTRVSAEQGQAVRQAGETVEPGDLVISSLVLPTTEQGSARLTHAAGEVEARTWYEETARRATVTGRKVYTGEEKTRFALVVGKNRINLYFGSGISDTSCDKIVEEMKIVIADSLEVPVYLERQTCRYYEEEPVEADPESLRETLTARAEERLRASISGEITASSAVLRPVGGGAELTLYAECLEDIGEEAVTTQELPPPEAAKGEPET